jgi:hypothetical protein
MFLGLQDPNPDPLEERIRLRIRIWIPPFSGIMLAIKDFNTKF